MKWLAMLLALLCVCAPACAEFDDMDDLDYWYEQMYALSEEIGCRPVGSENELAAMAYLRGEFERLGFETVNEYDVSNSQAKDLEVILPAQNRNANIIIICAHYDSAPPVTLDGVLCDVPGARDNASGTAGMLAMAREFVQMPPYADTELRFVAFTSEETGHQGSQAYVESMSHEERERTIAVFNLDLVTVDIWLFEHVFSVDTMGMRTPDGYVNGTDDVPAVNKVVRAVNAALEELEYFDPEENGVAYCVPRHLGMSDHDSFHFAGMDSANIAFRGNAEEGGSWHPYMHEADDGIGDFDWERTYQLLNTVFTAVDHLAADPAYGD